MTRKKVKLAFITNDSARKATYKKRKRGLLKKMDELTTLCDVKACAVLFSPYESRPVVWPGPSGARDVISSFKRLPEMEKVKKMVSQEEFMRQRVAKAHEQLKRQQKENREKEMTQIMYQCLTGKSIQNMNLLDLSDLGWVINQHLNEINKRIGALKTQDHSTPSNATTPSDNVTPSHHVRVNEGLHDTKEDFDAMHMHMMMQQPWSSFMDMMGPTIVHEHPHPSHHIGMGIGRLEYGSNGGEESNSSNSNSMNPIMITGQFGDNQGQRVNPTSWSYPFYS